MAAWCAARRPGRCARASADQKFIRRCTTSTTSHRTGPSATGAARMSTSTSLSSEAMVCRTRSAAGPSPIALASRASAVSGVRRRCDRSAASLPLAAAGLGESGRDRGESGGERRGLGHVHGTARRWRILLPDRGRASRERRPGRRAPAAPGGPPRPRPLPRPRRRHRAAARRGPTRRRRARGRARTPRRCPSLRRGAAPCRPRRPPRRAAARRRLRAGTCRPSRRRRARRACPRGRRACAASPRSSASSVGGRSRRG